VIAPRAPDGKPGLDRNLDRNAFNSGYFHVPLRLRG
jgi:hypothetical protein